MKIQKSLWFLLPRNNEIGKGYLVFVCLDRCINSGGLGWGVRWCVTFDSILVDVKEGAKGVVNIQGL